VARIKAHSVAKEERRAWAILTIHPAQFAG
jgi:hypothetical protein